MGRIKGIKEEGAGWGQGDEEGKESEEAKWVEVGGRGKVGKELTFSVYGIL